jgi:hypothetical protein
MKGSAFMASAVKKWSDETLSRNLIGYSRALAGAKDTLRLGIMYRELTENMIDAHHQQIVHYERQLSEIYAEIERRTMK